MKINHQGQTLTGVIREAVSCCLFKYETGTHDINEISNNKTKKGRRLSIKNGRLRDDEFKYSDEDVFKKVQKALKKYKEEDLIVTKVGKSKEHYNINLEWGKAEKKTKKNNLWDIFDETKKDIFELLRIYTLKPKDKNRRVALNKEYGIIIISNLIKTGVHPDMIKKLNKLFNRKGVDVRIVSVRWINNNLLELKYKEN